MKTENKLNSNYTARKLLRGKVSFRVLLLIIIALVGAGIYSWINFVVMTEENVPAKTVDTPKTDSNDPKEPEPAKLFEITRPEETN